MSGDMPARMSEDMSDRMSEDMPDRMSEDMPERMSEDMSDRMSEDGFKGWATHWHETLQNAADLATLPQCFGKPFQR